MRLMNAILAALGATNSDQGKQTLRSNEQVFADVPDTVIGTYLGGYPRGLIPPEPKDLSPEINLVMLSFAKETGDGNFKIDDWGSHLTADKILQDKKDSGRKYLISLGGSADSGGTFRPPSSMDMGQWLENAYSSIKNLIKTFNADGVELQFEDGVGDSRFKDTMNSLLEKMKQDGYITAVGPFFGYTDRYYCNLNMDNVDIVNMQMYTDNTNDVDRQVAQTEQTIALYPPEKFVYGLNSVDRKPEPQIGLQAFRQLLGKYKLKGLFTWTAEDSTINCKPSFCIEANAQLILQNPSSESLNPCEWGKNTDASKNRCGTSWVDANSNCNAAKCASDGDCSTGESCFADLSSC